MRCVLLASALLALAACGEIEPPARPLPAGLQLPEATRMGALPSSFGRVDVALTVEGGLSINGRPCEPEGLRAALVEASGGPRRTSRTAADVIEDLEEIEEVEEQEIVDEGPVPKPPVEPAPDRPWLGREPVPERRRPEVFLDDGSRAADVLLRVDRRASWGSVVGLLEALAQPRVMLWRVFVECVDAHGRTGALAVFLPKDRGLCGEAPLVPDRVRLRLVQRTGGPATWRAGDVAEQVARHRLLRTRPLQVEVQAEASVPWSAVVRAVDAALRGGAHLLEFRGFALDAEARALRRPAVGGPDAYDVAVTGAEAPRQAALLPALPEGRDAALYGVTNELGVEELPVLRDEEEVEVEPGAPAPVVPGGR